MTAPFIAACIQFTAGPDPEPNLDRVSGLIREARAAGADLIMTPEVTNFIESGRRRHEKARREAMEKAEHDRLAADEAEPFANLGERGGFHRRQSSTPGSRYCRR
jgi:predicted amidohydrolase